MRALGGYIFIVLVTFFVFSWFLGALEPLTSVAFATIAWLFLAVWRNFGGGNPVRNKINELQRQIKYANEDIEELTKKRVVGYKAETRYLKQKIKEYEREINELQ